MEKQMTGALAGLLVLVLAARVQDTVEPTQAEKDGGSCSWASHQDGSLVIRKVDESMSSDPPIPDPLPASAPNADGEYLSLGEALAAAYHAFLPLSSDDPETRNANFYCSNPGQDLRSWFHNDGIELESGIPTEEGGAPWNLRLRLKSIGREGDMQTVLPGEISDEGGRVEVAHHGAAITQWFKNTAEGLEQGFTIESPPRGRAGTMAVELAIDGLRAELVDEAEAAQFVDESGREILRYHGLKAWDATGKDIPVRMELRGSELALVANDVGAQYPLTIDPWFENLEANLGQNSRAETFGSSVDGEALTALVGVPGQDTSDGIDAGSIYLYMGDEESLEAGTIGNIRRYGSDDAEADDEFGYSVAMDGNYLIAGAPGDDDGAGAAYIFIRSGFDWSQQFKITAPAGERQSGDRFGYSVEISGSTVVIGSPGDDNGTGSVYVFTRQGDQWFQQGPKINQYANEEFGNAVAIHDDFLLIGEMKDDIGQSEDAGRVYLYTRSGNAWTYEQSFSGNSQAGANFGKSLATDSSERFVVGAPTYNRNSDTDAGAFFVYFRVNDSWDGKYYWGNKAGANLGSSVAISENYILVGAEGDDTADGGRDAGSADLWVLDGGILSPVYPDIGSVLGSKQFAAFDGKSQDLFGSAVAIDVFPLTYQGRTQQTINLLIGADKDFSPNEDPGGSAYLIPGGVVFNVAGIRFWQDLRSNLNLKFTADFPPSDDRFGGAVAIEDDTAIIGAQWGDGPVGPDSGLAYVFRRSDSNWWVIEDVLWPSATGDRRTNDHFGVSVALDVNENTATALVGKAYERGSGPGSAYVYTRTGTIWSQQQKLVADDGESGDRFGYSAALDGDTALVGAYASNDDAGSAYVFRRSGSFWHQEDKLTSGVFNPSRDRFGISVALDGDNALVGANWDDNSTGRAFHFTRSGTEWTRRSTLKAEDGAPGDLFGFSVDLRGETALVGSFRDNIDGASDVGSAYVFTRSGNTWSQQAKLVADDGQAEDWFGYAVALGEDSALIGSPKSDTVQAREAGSAYFFTRSGSIWTRQLKLDEGPGISNEDWFGAAVGLDGDTALIGAEENENIEGEEAGTAHVFLLGQLPEITEQPESRIVVPGQSVDFEVAVSPESYQPLTYRWRKNGLFVDDATSPILSLTVSELESEYRAQEGSYDCIVSNIGGVVTSAPATLTVNDLSKFDQVFPTPPPSSDGFLIVNVSPLGIEGFWRFVGEQAWRSSGFPASGLTTGDREIEFRPVSGYRQPLRELVTITSGAAATVINRQYFGLVGAGGSGSLSVSIQPESISLPSVPVEDRAQWHRLGVDDDDTWYDSGTVIDDLSPGTHLVEFKRIAGRATPPSSAVVVRAGEVTPIAITYRLADAPTGAVPVVLPFETVSTGHVSDPGANPYTYVGQLRSDTGSGTGFVVSPRVVATAAHVVYDDGTFTYATGLNWVHQRDRESYEPVPIIPRGLYIFDGYASRQMAENTPGESAPPTQNLDAAALYFEQEVARGGYGGFLASDAADNEWLLSDSLKTVVGYPVDVIDPAKRGRMHATPATDVEFERVVGIDPGTDPETVPTSGDPLRLYTTSDVTSYGGNSGGPVCVQFEGGAYYPAAIYLGGSGQTVVRAIDSTVIELFDKAAVSANGGDDGTGGGSSRIMVEQTTETFASGLLRVDLNLPEARWQLLGLSLPEEFYESGVTLALDSTVGFTIVYQPVPGYSTPPNFSDNVTSDAGFVTVVTGTYVPLPTNLDAWTEAELEYHGVTVDNGPLDDFDLDSVVHLLEFAFNLSPTKSDYRYVEPGTGTSGMPHVHVVGTGADSRLCVEFVRRKPSSNPGIDYICEFASSLGEGGFQEATSTETTTDIDSIWERVIIEDTVPAGIGQQRFGRLRIVEQ